MLRESDGNGNWQLLEDWAAAADCDSEICKKVNALVTELKADEKVLNERIALVRRRVSAEEKVITSR